MSAARWLAWGLVVATAVAMLLHGPIAQLPHYHDFADTRAWLGVPNAADVLSNLAFAAVAAWAAQRLAHSAVRERLGRAWPGFALFVAALAATAIGSGYYHWAPDNARLVWDRLPIALACAGLLAGVHARTHPRSSAWILAALCAFAVAAVAWWAWTDAHATGDLRPYLWLQGAPLVLVPLWQAQQPSPRGERIGFAVAIALYVAAKVLELNDAALLHATGLVSGHTLKHLVAAAAAMVIVASVTGVHTLRSPRESRAPPRGWSEWRRSR